MTEEELKALKKEVSQKKRIATEWASQIHDLVEDRLLIDYRQLPELATQAHQACLDWAEANARLEAAGNA
ncbi:hypothetical protein BAY1663_02825 [Pseudomonas sp. BAY1663]|jgi:hypothetical protein|uniref:Rop-like protein n=2 Tax=Stutzerimonas stutzeri TaxID=316 RepID=A4VJ81_STUS1|nr:MULTISPECIES: CCE_0567 family metalloprotein [Pseudomonadaceae]OCX94885.1 MAG: hypothetical protein BCV62_03010 [Pseudomonas sp. K35]HAW39396.1 hypothetical protein [Pseudomonas sp.]ABP79032.1 protein of unknown function DUF683 [Stutzerimonas stutzeri A1501]EXF44752.1 hypothetical protein BAY1663_02825 [Pseudomonas sp. BAY1663]KIZ32572.1 hypothetical protein LO50_23475 [Stutzerimonas stutzeri]